MLRRKYENQAQTMLEYTVVLTLVTGLMYAMLPLIKRSTQTMIRLVVDQIGNQHNAEQEFSRERGHLEHSYTSRRSQVNKRRMERLGIFNFVCDDTIYTVSNAKINMGHRDR